MQEIVVHKRKKIVFAISDFRIGGAQKIVADIVNSLSREYDIHLLVLFEFDVSVPNFFDIILPEISVHKLSFSSFFDWQSWKKLFSSLKEIDADLICSNLFFSNTVLRICKPFFRFKMVTVEHNVYVERTFSERIVNIFLSCVTDVIIAVSKEVLEFTRKTEFVTRKKIKLIYNGVNVKKFSSGHSENVKKYINIDSSKKIIISVGQMNPQKNHQLLIEAFSLFSKTRSQYVLVILGEGILRPELEKIIHRLNLNEKVFLPGILRNTEDFYAASSFFVLSSSFEGFPIVCLEALAAGLPIVSTQVSGPSEYIENGINGYLAESNPVAMAEAMEKMHNLIMKNGVEVVGNVKKLSEIFNLDHTVNEYHILFDKLLSMNRTHLW